MSKNERLFKISAILSILGFIVIFASGWAGNILANIWLNGVGGIVDTNEYEFRQQTYSLSFLCLGSVLFGVGLLAFLFSWYKKQEN